MAKKLVTAQVKAGAKSRARYTQYHVFNDNNYYRPVDTIITSIVAIY
jgi:hypothetical protein